MKTYLHLTLILASLMVWLGAPTPARAAGTTITVNGLVDDAIVANLAGNATCDLREAVAAAHTNTIVGQCPAGSTTLTDVDTIAFDLPGSGVQMISLAATLVVDSPMIIDGTSDPDFAGSPVVRIDGGGTVGLGLWLQDGSVGSTVKGLMITRFSSQDLILSASDGTQVVGNYLGTDGSTDLGLGSGLKLENADNVIVGGTAAADRNIIAGHSTDVYLNSGTSGALLKGNYIGVLADGSSVLGSSSRGILVSPTCCSEGGSANFFGGLNPGEGNVIAGHSIAEVEIESGQTLRSDGNTIQGNIIGLNAAGTAAVSVIGGDGIRLVNSDDTMIEGNVISGKTSSGIVVEHNLSVGGGTPTPPDGTIIRANKIGTSANGLADLGNGTGVFLAGATNTSVGGNGDFSKSNLISGNSYGIDIQNGSGNVVHTNVLGMDATYASNLPNSNHGMYLASSVEVVRNWVANSVTGIEVASGGDFTAATDNCITGNSTWGLLNASGDPVVFENSWWGDAGGPAGAGDDVSGVVDYDPFLTSAAGACGSSATLDAGSLGFGSQLVGTTSPVQTLTLSNPGLKTLNITSITADPPFLLDNLSTCPVGGGTLAANDNCDIDLQFAPSLVGPVSANLTITSDAGTSPDVIPLDGTGAGFLQNDSFETDLDTNKKPDGWTLKKFNSATDKRDCAKSQSGACSLKFVGNGASKSASQTVLQSGIAGDDFAFSLWSRAKGVPVGSTYRLQVKFYNGTTVLQTLNKNFSAGTHGFKQVTGLFTAPGAYDKIVYKIIFKAPSGTAWFDTAALNWVP